MGQKLLCPSCKKTVIEWKPNPYDDGLICNECYWREHFERLREEKERPIGSFLEENWFLILGFIAIALWATFGH